MAKTRLFSPVKIRGLVLRNRTVIAPMMQHSAENGAATAWHLVHLGKFALGGAGLILTESTSVSPVGCIGKDDLGLWSDEHVSMLSEITKFCHQGGAAVGVQLGHAGRKAGTRPLWEGGTPLALQEMKSVNPLWNRVGPSAIPAAPGWSTPKELSIAEIDEIVGQFVRAAERADAAGMDVIELHFGHGYLVASFLSPVSNVRSDEYGGSLSNRMRLALRIAREVRNVWPEEKPLFCRISCMDGALGGWGMNDTLVLAKHLKDQGVDVIDCSSGGISEQGAALPVARGIGFQVDFSRQVRQMCGIATQAVGMIVDPAYAESVLQEGAADLIAIGREALYDPYWPLHAMRELEPDLMFDSWPKQHGIWLQKRHPALLEALANQNPI